MNKQRLHGFNLIHRNDLVNMLQALRLVSHRMPDDQYRAGFDEALLTLARMVGVELLPEENNNAQQTTF